MSIQPRSFICLIATYFIIQAAPDSKAQAFGGTVSNGGHLIECAASAEIGSYNGHYALDYIVALQDPENSQEGLIPIRHWEETFHRLIRHFEGTAPELAQSLTNFQASMEPTPPDGARIYPGENKTRSWNSEYSDYFLFSNTDSSKLPVACRLKLDSLGQTLILEAITRSEDDESIRYRYHATAVPKLIQEQPLQASFLFIHEWLWDYTRDLRHLRKINFLLHTNAVEAMSRDEIRALFRVH